MDFTIREDGLALFTFDKLVKGEWSWPTEVGTPDGYVPLCENFDIGGGIFRSMKGNAVHIATAFASSGTVTMGASYKPDVTTDPYLLVALSDGSVKKYNGATWDTLRTGFSTAAGIWWTHQQMSTDLYMSNPTDGTWRWDGTNLLPIGAKIINNCDATTDWTGATQESSDFKSGTGSLKAASVAGAPATMTYNPSAVINMSLGRYNSSGGGNRNYYLTKAVGTDAIHFWVRITGAGTLDTTNTKVVITDTNAKTLTWPFTAWRTSKSTTGAAPAAATTTWYEVWLFPQDATESATFDPSIVDKLEFTVDTSADDRTMYIDDIYVVYLTTMPGVTCLCEWKNCLFGGYGDTVYFSKSAAADEFDVTATFPLKSGGEPIQGMARFFNQLTIGTSDHVFTISGSLIGQTYPSYLFDTNEVTDEFGISGHRSIVKADNKLWWFWKTHVLVYDGTKVEHADYPIDETIGLVDESKLQFVVGCNIPEKHQIWWTWIKSGQSAHTEVTRYDYNWNAFLPCKGLSTPIILRTSASGAHKYLTIDISTWKFYYQEASNYTFFGTNIDYNLKFPAMNAPGYMFEWIYSWVQFANQSSGSFNVQFRQADTLRALEGESFTTIETVAMNADGEYGKNRIGDRATYGQIQITASGAAVALQPPFVVVARPREKQFVRIMP